LRLCSKLQYVRINEGDLLCEQGEKGNLFYIILSGSVSVHIKPAHHPSQTRAAAVAAAAAAAVAGEDTVEALQSKDKDDDKRSPTTPQREKARVLRRRQNSTELSFPLSLSSPASSSSTVTAQRSSPRGWGLLRGYHMPGGLSLCLSDPPSVVSKHRSRALQTIDSLSQVESFIRRLRQHLTVRRSHWGERDRLELGPKRNVYSERGY